MRDFACVCDAADAMEAKLTEVCGGQHNMVGKDRGQGKWYIYIYIYIVRHTARCMVLVLVGCIG